MLCIIQSMLCIFQSRKSRGFMIIGFMFLRTFVSLDDYRIFLLEVFVP